MASKCVAPSRGAPGFTLIELMVAITIGAILVSIALPAFMYEIRKSRRTDARTALLDMAARAERLYATTNSYQNAATGTLSLTDLGYPAGAWPTTVGSGFYTVNLTLTSPTQFQFTANAVGTQVSDTQCVAFTIDNTGAQGSVDSSNNNTNSTCWN
jgi:type IV pilus assembly protein PilE